MYLWYSLILDWITWSYLPIVVPPVTTVTISRRVAIVRWISTCADHLLVLMEEHVITFPVLLSAIALLVSCLLYTSDAADE